VTPEGKHLENRPGDEREQKREKKRKGQPLDGNTGQRSLQIRNNGIGHFGTGEAGRRRDSEKGKKR